MRTCTDTLTGKCTMFIEGAKKRKKKQKNKNIQDCRVDVGFS